MDEESSRESRTERRTEPFAALPEPAAVYGLDEGRPVVRATNEAFERLFADDVSPGDPRSALPGAMSFGDDGATTIETEIDGERRDFRVRISETADGGVVAYAEVTELTRNLARVRAQRNRLDDFAGVLAHDLKNPLEVASARTELARELGGDEHLGKVEGALERMDEIVTELLALARDGAVVGETATVRLGECARDAWDTVPTGEATLSVDDAVTVEADRARLQELLENLFRNAVEHGSPADRPGDNRIAVRVGAVEESGTTVGFYIADDGVGIPPESRSDVFDPGVTIADGTGFGLTVVDRIAAGHGWEVTADESEAGGARFVVTDPAGASFSPD